MNAPRPVTGLASVLKSLNCDGRYRVALMALVCLLLLPEVWGDAARVGMRYDRAALAAGEWWRGFTAHHVHLDWVHAGLNVLGAVLMWALFARDYSAARWLAIWVASCLGVTIGIWCLNPDVGWYVGASGSLHGVMTAGTLAHLRRDDLDSWILAAFIIAKLAYETWAGQLPLAESDNTIAEAHLYGAVGGLVAATFLASRREPVSL